MKYSKINEIYRHCTAHRFSRKIENYSCNYHCSIKTNYHKKNYYKYINIRTNQLRY